MEWKLWNLYAQSNKGDVVLLVTAILSSCIYDATIKTTETSARCNKIRVIIKKYAVNYVGKPVINKKQVSV